MSNIKTMEVNVSKDTSAGEFISIARAAHRMDPDIIKIVGDDNAECKDFISRLSNAGYKIVIMDPNADGNLEQERHRETCTQTFTFKMTAPLSEQELAELRRAIHRRDPDRVVIQVSPEQFGIEHDLKDSLVLAGYDVRVEIINDGDSMVLH